MYPARPPKRRKITNATILPIYSESTNEDGSKKLHPSLINIHHEVLGYSNRLTVAAIAKIFGIGREVLKMRLGNIRYEDRNLTVDDLSKLSIEEAKKIWGQTYYRSILTSQYKILTDYSLRELQQHAKKSSNFFNFAFVLGILRPTLKNSLQSINLFLLDLSYLDETDIKLELKEEQYNKKIEFGSCFNLSIITLEKIQRCIQQNIPIGIDIELINSHLENFIYRGCQLNLDMMCDASFNLLEVDYGPLIKGRVKINLHGPIYVDSKKIIEYQEDETFINTDNANSLIQTTSGLNILEPELMQANTFQIQSDILHRNDFQYIDLPTTLNSNIENSGFFAPLNEVAVLDHENNNLKNLTNSAAIFSPDQNPQNINDTFAAFLNDAVIEMQPNTSQDLSYVDATLMSQSNNNSEVTIQTQYSSASLARDNDKLLAPIKDNISLENLSNENDVLEYLCLVENDSPTLLTTNIEHTSFSDFVKKITASNSENNNLDNLTNTLIVDSTFDQLVYPNNLNYPNVNETFSASLDDAIVETQSRNNKKNRHVDSYKKRNINYPSLAYIHKLFLDYADANTKNIANILNISARTLVSWISKKKYKGASLTIALLRKMKVEEAKEVWGEEYYKPIVQIGLNAEAHSYPNVGNGDLINNLVELPNESPVLTNNLSDKPPSTNDVSPTNEISSQVDDSENLIENGNTILDSENNNLDNSTNLSTLNNIIETVVNTNEKNLEDYDKLLNKKHEPKISQKFNKKFYPSLAAIHRVLLDNEDESMEYIAKRFNTTRFTLAKLIAKKTFNGFPLTLSMLRDEISVEQAKALWGKDYDEPLGVIRGIYHTTYSSLNLNQAQKLNINVNNQQAETTTQLSDESLVATNNSITILDNNGVAQNLLNHSVSHENLSKEKDASQYICHIENQSPTVVTNHVENSSFFDTLNKVTIPASENNDLDHLTKQSVNKNKHKSIYKQISYPSLAYIHKLFLDNPKKNSYHFALMLNITRKTLYNWLSTKIYKDAPLTFTILRKITEEEAKKVWGEDYYKPIIQSNQNNIPNNENISHQQTEYNSSRLENNLTSLDIDGDVDSAANDISNQVDEIVRKIIPGLTNEKIQEHSQYFLNYLYKQRDLIAQTTKKFECLTGKSVLQQDAKNQNSTILNKNRLFTPANKLSSRTENVEHNEDDMQSGCIP